MPCPAYQWIEPIPTSDLLKKRKHTCAQKRTSVFWRFSSLQRETLNRNLNDGFKFTMRVDTTNVNSDFSKGAVLDDEMNALERQGVKPGRLPQLRFHFRLQRNKVRR